MSTSSDPPGKRLRRLGESVRGRRVADPSALLAREQALRQQAEAARGTLRSIFEAVPGCLAVLTAHDDYRIVGVTEAYLEVTMTRRADIVEQPLFDAFPGEPGAAAAVRASLGRVRKTLKTDVVGVGRYPIARPAAQGGGFEDRYFSVVHAPVLDPDGELAYIIQRVEDVTEFVRSSGLDASRVPARDFDRRRHVEAEIVRRTLDLQAVNDRLRESEARYREFIHALPAAIYTCDALGHVQVWNDAAVELWGREPEPASSLTGGPWRLFRTDGTPLPLEESPMARAVREGRFVRGDLVIERPDGTRRGVQANATPTFDAGGRVSGTVNLLVDRTELWRAQEDQARLAAIVDSSDDAIVGKDLNGVVRSWNHGAERIFGWRADEIIGRSITVILPPELVAEEDRILERIRHGEHIEHFETVRIAKDGRRIDVSLTISPIHNAAGEVIGLSKISRDITESRRIARALAEADRRKDRFLATLAHELRNPLAALSSAVELLALPDAPRRLESTRCLMERQTRHLVRLVDDLLDLSRFSRGRVRLRREILDARGVVERAIETVRPALDARRHLLVVRIGREPLSVHADPTRLEQMLVNLLANAAKFTPPGGRIEVSARPSGEHVVLSVRDNGVGMSAELLPTVFEEFAQSQQSPDRAAGGLGIGLSLVRSLALLHGGTVEAHSAGPGEGSEFVLTLPAHAATGRSEPPPEPVPVPDAEAPAAGRRVLVVDDNEDAADGLARLLEFSGHVVCQAYNGPAALEMAATFRPDAVLLDIGLPELDGYEVARRLRADPACEDVLLIALSGYCQEEDRRRSREAGFDHHVAKPVGHRDLLRLLAGSGR